MKYILERQNMYFIILYFCMVNKGAKIQEYTLQLDFMLGTKVYIIIVDDDIVCVFKGSAFYKLVPLESLWKTSITVTELS